MSMNRMRMIPIAAVVLGAVAVHAAPAHAARIPVPRLDTGRVVVLTIPDRATAALPTQSASVSSLRSAFEGARPQMQRRLDEIAEAAAEQSALRTRLKTCLEGVRGAAVEQWLEGRAAGAAPDFNELVYSGAVSCFSSQFPEAVGERIDQFAQAAAGQANDAAYEEVSVQGEAAGTSGGGAYGGGSTEDGGDDGGISIALVAGGLVLLGSIAIVAFIATGRRI
jgi:hypothetical protein